MILLMAERVSEIVVHSLTLSGWKDRVLHSGETVSIDRRPLRIASMRLVSGMPEGQEPPPPRTNIVISSHMQQGEESALQVTTTREGGEVHTQLTPIYMLGPTKRKRSVPEKVRSLFRHGVISEYVGVRPRR